MDKMRFKQLLKEAGYTVSDQENYPVVIVNGDKKLVSKTFMDIKLFANKVGYHHTVGVRKALETKVIDFKEEKDGNT